MERPTTCSTVIVCDKMMLWCLPNELYTYEMAMAWRFNEQSHRSNTAKKQAYRIKWMLLKGIWYQCFVFNCQYRVHILYFTYKTIQMYQLSILDKVIKNWWCRHASCHPLFSIFSIVGQCCPRCVGVRTLLFGCAISRQQTAYCTGLLIDIYCFSKSILNILHAQLLVCTQCTG